MKVFIIFLLALALAGSIELNARQAIPFRKVGQVYVNQATLRVRVKFDLSPFSDLCLEIQELDRKAYQSDVESRYYEMQQMDITTESGWRSLDDSCLQVRSWPTDFGLYSEARHERNPLAIGALMGFGLTMAASMVVDAVKGDSEVDQLAAQVREQAEYLRGLTARVHELGNWRIQVELRLTATEVHVAVSDISQGLSSLISTGRLGSALLPARDLRPLWQQVERVVNKLEGEAILPFQQAASMYEFPATFIFVQGRLEVEVFLPLVTESLELLWREPFPLASDNLGNPLLVRKNWGEEFLAVDRKHTVYLTLSTEELLRCHQQQRRYFCPGTLLRKDYAETCEASLFSARQEGVELHCQTTPYTRTWAVWQGEARNVHLFSVQDMQAEMRCFNGTVRSDVLEAGFHDMLLSSSCSYSTKHFYIPRDVEYEYEASLVTPRLPGVSGLREAQEDLNRIKELQGKIEAGLAKMAEGRGMAWWEVTLIAVGSLFGLFGAGVCVYTLYTFKKCEQRNHVT